MDIYDPSSAAYKKARRQHLKTTKNRGKDVDAEWTPFRAAEKKYKARFPPPDLSHVLDLASVASDSEALASGRNFCCNGVNVIPLGQRESSVANVCKAFSVPHIPGAQDISRGGNHATDHLNRSRYTPIIHFLRGSATTSTMGSSRSRAASQRNKP